MFSIYLTKEKRTTEQFVEHKKEILFFVEHTHYTLTLIMFQLHTTANSTYWDKTQAAACKNN